MSTRISSRLRQERIARRMSQSEMAEFGGVSRQSLAAIEAGASVPSTEVALRLSRSLGMTVEDLFQLPETPREVVDVEVAAPLSGAAEGPAAHPIPVRLAEIGGKRLAVPLGQGAGPMEPADGVARRLPNRRMRVELFEERPSACDLIVLGCDPAFALVQSALRGAPGIETLWIRCGSRAALAGLAEGHAHVAGVHLVDPESGTYNERWIRELVPFSCTRVLFAEWEQCLMFAPGNPFGVEKVSDLAQGGLRFVNREPGSGSRALLDQRLGAEGVPEDRISGYGKTAVHGHMAVAEAIGGGLADAGVGIRAAALACGLDSVSLARETYELVIPDHLLEHAAVRALLMLLRTSGIRTQVEALGGYDTEGMGLPL